MIQFIRHHWRITKSRVRHLLTQPDRESAEGLGFLALLWQVNRLALADGRFGLPTADITTGSVSVAGRHLTEASNAFWQGLVNQSSWFNLTTVTCVLLVVTVAAFLGLVEEWTHVRLGASFCAAAWWLWSGAMLSFHTQGHLGGGLSLIWGAAAAWVCIGLYRRMGEEDYARSVAGRTRAQSLDIARPEAGHVTRQVNTPVITRSEQCGAVITRTATGGKT